MHRVTQWLDNDKTGAGTQFYVKIDYEAVTYGLCLYHHSPLTLWINLPIFKTHKLPGKAIYLLVVGAKPLPNPERDSMEGAESTVSALCPWADDPILSV